MFKSNQLMDNCLIPHYLNWRCSNSVFNYARVVYVLVKAEVVCLMILEIWGRKIPPTPYWMRGEVPRPHHQNRGVQMCFQVYAIGECFWGCKCCCGLVGMWECGNLCGGSVHMLMDLFPHMLMDLFHQKFWNFCKNFFYIWKGLGKVPMSHKLDAF